MTERPYKNYDIVRLFAEKRGIEDALKQVKREHSSYLKSVYGRPPYHPGVYEDEDYVGMSRHIDSLSKDLAEINAELFIQQRSPAGDGPRSRGAGGNLVDVACSCRPPRHFRLAGRAHDGGPIICGNCNQAFKLK